MAKRRQGYRFEPFGQKIPLHRQLPDLRVQLPDLRLVFPARWLSPLREHLFHPFHCPLLPGAHLVRVDLAPCGDLLDRLVPAWRLQRTFALKSTLNRRRVLIASVGGIHLSLSNLSDFPGPPQTSVEARAFAWKKVSPTEASFATLQPTTWRYPGNPHIISHRQAAASQQHLPAIVSEIPQALARQYLLR